MAHMARILAALFVGAFLAARAGAQAYGSGDQTLTLGALSFTGQSNQGSLHPDGYLYASGPYSYSAEVTLPNGGQITQVCLFAANTKAGASIQLKLEAMKLAPGGQPPGIVPIAGASVTAAFTTGYDSVCSGPVVYTFHDVADVDGDGTPELVAHRLTATFSAVNDGSLALGGARVVWHRQISPAPVTPSFTDVPVNHLFFEEVEALAASGITSGCSTAPPKYCPSNPLTRGQMAAFLARAFGLHWPY